jgi:glutamine amidotransferase
MSKFGILMLPGSNVHAVNYWAKRGGVDATLVSRPEQVRGLDCLILPGVGAFDDAVSYLDRSGLRQAVVAHAELGRYLVGICLGMQVLFESSEEGISRGLGLLPGGVQRIPVGLDRVPNIGWRPVNSFGVDRILTDKKFFFMHSYGVPAQEFADVVKCDKVETVKCNVHLLASFRMKNLIGFQYHPEKSYIAGDRLFSEILHAIQSYR